MITVYQWSTDTPVGHASIGIDDSDCYLSFHPALSDVDTSSIGGFIGSLAGNALSLAAGTPEFSDLDDDFDNSTLVDSVTFEDLDEGLVEHLIEDFKENASIYNLMVHNCAKAVAKTVLMASHQKQGISDLIVGFLPLSHAEKRNIFDALEHAEHGAYADSLFDASGNTLGAAMYNSMKNNRSRVGRVMRSVGGVLVAASAVSEISWTPPQIIDLAHSIDGL